MYDNILIIDYGSQYTQLIARRIRELKVFCNVYPYNKITLNLVNKLQPAGIILSGGPNSVLDAKAPKLSNFILDLRIPILGICYGLQLLCFHKGGKINKSKSREYGNTFISITNNSYLFHGINNKNQNVWMSHGDHIVKLPSNFIQTSISNNNVISSIENKKLKIYGLQFHPEVFHTANGKKILNNYLFKICLVKNKFELKDFIKNKIYELKLLLKDEKVICGLSGGVDSTVTAYLLHKAINNNLFCIFVDHGLLRKNEANEVISIFKKKFNKNFVKINA